MLQHLVFVISLKKGNLQRSTSWSTGTPNTPGVGPYISQCDEGVSLDMHDGRILVSPQFMSCACDPILQLFPVAGPWRGVDPAGQQLAETWPTRTTHGNRE